MIKWWRIYRYVQKVKSKSEDDSIKWRDPPQNGAQCILRHDSRLESTYVFPQTKLRMETIFMHYRRAILNEKPVGKYRVYTANSTPQSQKAKLNQIVSVVEGGAALPRLSSSQTLKAAWAAKPLEAS
jgi:hypothetical protein